MQVQPLIPPAEAEVGELITFAGCNQEPVEAGNRATKAFSKISDDLFVDDNGIATFQGTPFMTRSGPVISAIKGKIS